MSDQAKTSDQVKETGQKANDRLEKPPDALEVRNPTPVQRDAALDAFTNKFDSMTDLLAIGEKGQSFGIKHDDGKVETTEAKKKHKLAEDPHPTSMMATLTPAAEARIKAQKQAKHELISESATHMAIEATSNPAMQPVALVRKHADSLPDGDPRKQKLTELSRELAAEYSPKMRDRYAQEKLTSTPEGWLQVCQQIGQLPLDKQFEVIGSGLRAGIEQYQQDDRERTWGRLIGTVQGTGEVLQGLAKIADFGAACILGDNQRAGKMGDEFGTALGQTIVGGVRLFQAADQYLFNIGYTGDYAKPFRDVVTVGQKLDQRWSGLPPREQERIKTKLITELIASGAIGAAGASTIQKASKFTEVLDAVAMQAQELHAASKPVIKKAVNAVSNAVEELVQPVGDTGMGVRMPIPKDPLKDETKMLMSKADDIEGKDFKPSRKEASDRMPPGNMQLEIEEAIKALDQPLLDILKKQKVHIEIVEKMEDAFPGDPTKKRLMGAYDWGRNTIFIPKKVWHRGDLIDNFDVDFALRHEIGHVINAKSLERPGLYYSRPVRLSEKMGGFIEAFQKDLSGVPDDVWRKLDFDKTTAEGLSFARDEVFADTYAHATGFPTKNPRSKLIKQYFANTLKFMQENLHV